jgi:hypothetical protein
MAFFLLTFTGCKKYEQISLVSGKVESLNMNGLRSADLLLSVKVDNPAGKVKIEEAKGTLKHSGKVIGNVTLAPLILNARIEAEYKPEAKIELEKGVGLMQLMSFMNINKLNECTIDLYVKVKAAGIRVKKQFKDMPVKKLLEEYYYEKI